MNWFNGRLEITFKDGSSEIFHDINFNKASELCKVQEHLICSALYFPSTISMV